MPSKKHKAEEIIGKLREVEIVLAQGSSTADTHELFAGCCQSDDNLSPIDALRPF